MKFFKSRILFIGIALFICSCSTQRQAEIKSHKVSSYIQHLSSIINDTAFYEFAQYSIVDKSIFPILDSVILLSEKCSYFDSNVKYLNSFRFGVTSKNENHSYSIDAHLSPAQAIGLILVESGAVDEIRNIGMLYYRNYLFVIPSATFGMHDELIYFPFIKKTGKKLKIRAPEFFDGKVYSSYITFMKKDDGFKIVENEICGPQILIQ